MTRDTRNNLIFLAILLPLLMPGAIMLFKAKLDPEAKRMFQPDFVRKEVLYNNYDDQRPTEQRYVPPMTSQWLRSEARDTLHPSAQNQITFHTGLASKEHRFEVVGIASSEASGSSVLAVLWDPNMTSPAFVLGDDPMAIVATFTRDLPPAVRKELQKSGFVKPPKNVRVYLVQSKDSTTGQTLIVHYQTQTGEARLDQLTDLPQENDNSHGALPVNTQFPAAK